MGVVLINYIMIVGPFVSAYHLSGYVFERCNNRKEMLIASLIIVAVYFLSYFFISSDGTVLAPTAVWLTLETAKVFTDITNNKKRETK